MTAVLQFEVNKKRLRGYASVRPFSYVYQLAELALRDTFDNGGTFVMVVSADTITIVQRAEAENFDEKNTEMKP